MHNAQLFALSGLPVVQCLKRRIHFTNVHTEATANTSHPPLIHVVISSKNIHSACFFPSADDLLVVCADT